MSRSTLRKTLAGMACLLGGIGAAYADKIINYPPFSPPSIINNNNNNNNNNNTTTTTTTTSSWNNPGDSTFTGSDNPFFNGRSRPISGQTVCLQLDDGTRYQLLFKTLRSPFLTVAGTVPDDNGVLDGTAVRMNDGSYVLTLTKTTDAGASVIRMQLPTQPPGTFSEVDLLHPDSVVSSHVGGCG